MLPLPQAATARNTALVLLRRLWRARRANVPCTHSYNCLDSTSSNRTAGARDWVRSDPPRCCPALHQAHPSTCVPTWVELEDKRSDRAAGAVRACEGEVPSQASDGGGSSSGGGGLMDGAAVTGPPAHISSALRAVSNATALWRRTRRRGRRNEQVARVAWQLLLRRFVDDDTGERDALRRRADGCCERPSWCAWCRVVVAGRARPGQCLGQHARRRRSQPRARCRDNEADAVVTVVEGVRELGRRRASRPPRGRRAARALRWHVERGMGCSVHGGWPTLFRTESSNSARRWRWRPSCPLRRSRRILCCWWHCLPSRRWRTCWRCTRSGAWYTSASTVPPRDRWASRLRRAAPGPRPPLPAPSSPAAAGASHSRRLRRRSQQQQQQHGRCRRGDGLPPAAADGEGYIVAGGDVFLTRATRCRLPLPAGRATGVQQAHCARLVPGVWRASI